MATSPSAGEREILATRFTASLKQRKTLSVFIGNVMGKLEGTSAKTNKWLNSRTTDDLTRSHFYQNQPK